MKWERVPFDVTIFITCIIETKDLEIVTTKLAISCKVTSFIEIGSMTFLHRVLLTSLHSFKLNHPIVSLNCLLLSMIITIEYALCVKKSVSCWNYVYFCTMNDKVDSGFKNVITTCRESFYASNFMTSIVLTFQYRSKIWLMCFQNGIEPFSN